jgi:hypothetical protein
VCKGGLAGDGRLWHGGTALFAYVRRSPMPVAGFGFGESSASWKYASIIQDFFRRRVSREFR